MEGIDENDPLVAHFKETFKDLNLSQVGFERVLSEFDSFHRSAAKVDMAAEMKKLGPGGPQEVAKINTWIDNTFDDATAETVRNWVSSADDMKALQALRAFQPRSAIPGASDMLQVASFESSADIKSDMNANWAKYKSDEVYRGEMMNRMGKAVQREKHGKK